MDLKGTATSVKELAKLHLASYTLLSRRFSAFVILPLQVRLTVAAPTE